MTIIEDRAAELERLTLDSGGHDSWEKGACVMEAVAYVAGEPFSDHPECASPVITSFLISWNDALPTDQRQMLKPYITRVVGTNTGAADDGVRAWMCTDWLARECAPACLRLAGLRAPAELLEQLSPLVDASSAKAAQPALDEAREKGDAARDAARDVARAAAWDAARAAAWDVARAAAWDVARAVAWDVARAVAWDVAWAAARDVAWDAARDAARDVAEKTDGSYEEQYRAAYKAAKPLIDAKFEDTSKGLQTSAFLLLDRMIAVGQPAETNEGVAA